ncbi:hypothetical protein BDE36_2565 [Arcticibacter tournemirensis]|uniref:DUF3240 domain-containing protein n=1 Tax=Arcticibacter tournemirensis TaxID=699437 RepID=A0A5M9GPV5_9SPHI|nr:hypothetical protein [Arcticibacter tournemirensis]KAA8476783.1 hypothetical protein F1649_19620 [Arcticibacter tournemirensis]TQM50803.1 hypothetical protein BDE36_2565 [Arcticibacter tournemirensis]
MKLLLITGLQESSEDIAKIIREAGISIFSTSAITGFKDNAMENLLDHWFSSGTESYNSVFLFSFTEEERAAKALSLIHEFNRENDSRFPVRGFMLPVEASVY